MEMKHRLLMGFCVIILLMSAAAVTIQAWGIPDDIQEAMEKCVGYCSARYEDEAPEWKICFEACLFGATGIEYPPN